MWKAVISQVVSSGSKSVLSFQSFCSTLHSLYISFLFQPQNILLTSLSPPGDIKIVDFGLARRLGAVGELREILGTPEYVGKVMFMKHALILGDIRQEVSGVTTSKSEIDGKIIHFEVLREQFSPIIINSEGFHTSLRSPKLIDLKIKAIVVC